MLVFPWANQSSIVVQSFCSHYAFGDKIAHDRICVYDPILISESAEECLPVKIRQILNFAARVKNLIWLIFLW